MRQVDTGDTGDIQVAYYFDCDEGLHLLPLEDVDHFSDRVYDPFPERKNGRYGATVVLGTDNPAHDPTLERRAIQKAKHLIGLKKQEVKLAQRQQEKDHTHDKRGTTADHRAEDRSGVEQPGGAEVAAAGGHITIHGGPHTDYNYSITIDSE